MMKIVLSAFGLLLIYTVTAQKRLTDQSQCGDSLEATRAIKTFETPNFPSNYPSHLDCVWVIRSSVAGKQVEVQFTKIRSEKGCDFLKVRDGDSSSDKQLLLTTGDGNITWNLVSTFGALYIEFTSDDSVEMRGFQVQYRLAHVRDITCGGQVYLNRTEPSIISSPNYFSASHYPSGSYCLWTIEAPLGKQVNLTVIDFQIEPCCDSLLIKDGTEKSSKIVALVFGTSKKENYVISTGGKLLVRFRSDASVNFKGFRASARSVVVPTRPVQPTLPPVTIDCKQTLSVPSIGHGTFTSPNYPSNYPGNLECYWVLRAPTGSRIQLWFGLINTDTCCGWIKVRNGPNYDSPKIAVISGTPVKSLPNYVSTSNEMRVGFDTGDHVYKIGFRAYYEIFKVGHFASTSNCGGKLKATDTPQYFSSPNFPDAYEDSSLCTWTITSPRNTQIKMVFLALHLEKKFDTLTVEERVPIGKKNVQIRFTGNQLTIYTLFSKSNGVKIVLKSDKSVSYAGFRATYVIQHGLSNKDGK